MRNNNRSKKNLSRRACCAAEEEREVFIRLQYAEDEYRVFELVSDFFIIMIDDPQRFKRLNKELKKEGYPQLRARIEPHPTKTDEERIIVEDISTNPRIIKFQGQYFIRNDLKKVRNNIQQKIMDVKDRYYKQAIFIKEMNTLLVYLLGKQEKYGKKYERELCLLKNEAFKEMYSFIDSQI